MADFLSMDSYEWQTISEMISRSEFDEVPDVNLPVSPTPRPSSSRFGTVDKENVENFISEQQNENTKRKTLGDMRLFNQFCKEQGEKRPAETLSVPELDELFGNFIAVVKKTDGKFYEPSTIRGFLSSQERYLRSKGYQHSVTKNPLFPHINNALRAKMAFLKSEGYGSKPQEADELTDEDIDFLFKCGQLGNGNATQIINSLHLNFSVVMGMRGGRKQYTLKWGDIELRTDEDGDEYLEQSRERQTKTRTGNDPTNTRKFKPKVWHNADEPERCPVQAYKLYRDHRPSTMLHKDDPFFLSINHVKNPNPSTAWFKACAMGINNIYGLIKKMTENCSDINDDRKITNHSARKHLMQKCNDLGIPANCAIQISGHKNIASANTYSKINQKQQKQITSALANTKCPSLFHSEHSGTVLPLQNRISPPSTVTNVNEALPAQIQKTPANVCYSQQATSSTSEFQCIFHGSTVIHGGTFNFYTNDAKRSLEQAKSPKRKFKRVMCLDSDSD